MSVSLSKIAGFAKWAAHVERFHYERGRIIGLWAGIESGLDEANVTAWHYSDRKISKVVPQTLRWKLDLFERIHRELLPFAQLRREATAIVKAIKARQDDRNWLAHGMFGPVGRVADGWHLKKVKYLPNGDTDTEARCFTAAEMKAIRHDLTRLSGRVIRYSVALRRQLEKHALDDKLG